MPAAAPAAPAAAPAAAPPPPPPPPAPKVPEIVISYRSSWDRVFLHFNVDGKGWTNAPGVQMENAGNKEKVARVQVGLGAERVGRVNRAERPKRARKGAR